MVKRQIWDRIELKLWRVMIPNFLKGRSTSKDKEESKQKINVMLTCVGNLHVFSFTSSQEKLGQSVLRSLVHSCNNWFNVNKFKCELKCNNRLWLTKPLTNEFLSGKIIQITFSSTVSNRCTYFFFLCVSFNERENITRKERANFAFYF